MKSRGEIIVAWLIGTLLALTQIAPYAPIAIVVLGAFHLDTFRNYDFGHDPAGLP